MGCFLSNDFLIPNHVMFSKDGRTTTQWACYSNRVFYSIIVIPADVATRDWLNHLAPTNHVSSRQSVTHPSSKTPNGFSIFAIQYDKSWSVGLDKWTTPTLFYAKKKKKYSIHRPFYISEDVTGRVNDGSSSQLINVNKDP